MGTFPTKLHKMVIVGSVMLSLIANMEAAFDGGLGYTLGYIFGMAGMATLVVWLASAAMDVLMKELTSLE